MIRIILDTNAMRKEGFYFRTASAQALLTYVGRSAKVRLCVSEIAILELVNLYREELLKTIDALDHTLTSLKKLEPHFIDAPAVAVNIDESVSHFEHQLRERLAHARVRVLPIPEVPHELVIKRALAKRKPFDDKGRGYRDSLMWEAILVECANANQDVYFITGDKTNFGEQGSSSPSLCPQLKTDLEERATNCDLFHLFPDVASFVNDVVTPTLTRLDEVANQLLHDTFPDLKVSDLLQQQADHIGHKISNDLPASQSVPRVPSHQGVVLHNFGPIDKLSVYELNAGALYILFRVRAYCTVQLPSEASNLPSEALVEVPIVCAFEYNTADKTTKGFEADIIPRRPTEPRSDSQ